MVEVLRCEVHHCKRRTTLNRKIMFLFGLRVEYQYMVQWYIYTEADEQGTIAS